MNMIAEDNVGYSYESVNEVEKDFYHAFEQGDIELMKRVLADENVSYTHPSSPVIVGRQAVIDYWDFLLRGINETVIHRKLLNKINYNNIEIHLVSELDESNGKPSETITTNIFIKQKNGWRLQMQHSSPSGDVVDTRKLKEFEEMMSNVLSSDA